ncbi:hypothetical protein D3C76_1862460 [compost metagenome]
MAGQEDDRPADGRQHAGHGKAEELARIGAQAQRQARFEEGIAVEEHHGAHGEDQ